MEQIVFPIPEICEYLTEETKRKTYLTAERDDQGSKVADFFAKSEDMFTEMNWQKNLRNQPYLFMMSNNVTHWSTLIFWCSLAINFIVAKFYPFDASLPHSSPSGPSGAAAGSGFLLQGLLESTREKGVMTAGPVLGIHRAEG